MVFQAQKKIGFVFIIMLAVSQPAFSETPPAPLAGEQQPPQREVATNSSQSAENAPDLPSGSIEMENESLSEPNEGNFEDGVSDSFESPLPRTVNQDTPFVVSDDGFSDSLESSLPRTVNSETLPEDSDDAFSDSYEYAWPQMALPDENPENTAEGFSDSRESAK